MTKIKESEFVFQHINLYNQQNYYVYTNSPIAFNASSSGFLFTNNERILSNVMVENPSLSKNELIFARNDIRDKDTLVYKHSQKFLGFNFTKNTSSSFTTSLNYLADEWARFNAIFSNKLLTTRLSTSKSNVMFKRYFNNVKSMIDMSSGSTGITGALSEYRAMEVNRDMTCDNHYLFSLDSSYKSAGLLSVLNDTNNSQKYILFTDASCSQGVWNDFPQYNFQSLFIYKGDDINIETYSSTFAANTQNTGDILKNTLLTTNAIPNNQLTYLFTDFTNRSIYFLKTSQFKSSGALKAYRHFTFTTILKATWGVNETILNAKFAANTIQNFENITTLANFQASSFGVLGQAGSHADARYFTKYLGYMGQDFAGQNYFLYINEGATRDTDTASTNVENVISNLETTLKNSWTTAIIKENPTNGTTTNLKNINYTYVSQYYEIGNTNRNVAITSTTSVALTLNKNNTFNLTTTNVTYYAPVSPANNDIFRVQHLGSTGSFKVNVSATNSTVLVPLTTSASVIKIYYFKYNSSNTTWELQTDLGYFPIPGTHLWNEPRTGLVSTYLPVPSKAIVSPNNSNIYYFYAPAYTNTNFSSSKVTAGLSIYTPILYTWDKSLTTSDAITILDTSITYPGSDTWLTYANTHTEGYNKGTGFAEGTEFYYNHETAGKTRESHDNSQLYKFFHHNFITKVGSRYFLNHCIFYGTDHNANILVNNSNNGLSTLQKEKCRKIITYEINTSNWRSLTYHSSYGFNDTQLGFLPLDETNFTKILINQKNSVSILNFDTTTGWTLSALHEGNFIQISRDSNDTIWAVKCNINLSEKLYGNLLTNLVSQKVIFELHKLSEVDSGGLLNLSYRVELNEENKENIFYQSTIDDATNSIIKNLKLSVYDINNIRQSIQVNLQIQNGDGKVLFNDNGLDYISVTSDYGDDVNIEVLIQESRHFYIVASIDIL